MYFELLMNVGTVAAAIGTLPNIWAAIKDRHSLKGYNPYGSAALCFAMFCFLLAFAEAQFWPSFISEIPPIIFWGIATYYSWKSRR